MNPSPAYVRAVALGGVEIDTILAALPDASIEVAVTEAARHYTSRTTWTQHELVVALHALHILALSGALGPAIAKGPVISAGAGGVSMSVGVSAVTPGDGLDLRTPWGARALSLLRTEPVPGRMARGGYSPFWG